MTTIKCIECGVSQNSTTIKGSESIYVMWWCGKCWNKSIIKKPLEKWKEKQWKIN